METITVALQAVSMIDGNDMELTGWKVFVALDDLSPFEPGSSFTVEANLNFSTESNTISITQIIPYNSIIPGTPNLLPFKGTLWLLGKTNATKLVDYTVNLAYVPASS